jgi:hypothetical protein
MSGFQVVLGRPLCPFGPRLSWPSTITTWILCSKLLRTRYCFSIQYISHYELLQINRRLSAFNAQLNQTIAVILSTVCLLSRETISRTSPEDEELRP